MPNLPQEQALASLALFNGTSVGPTTMQSAMKGILNVVLFSWIVFGVFVWIMRDGLGPDSVATSGWSALVRFFWTFYWGPVFLVLVVATMALRRCMHGSLVDPEAIQLDAAADRTSHASRVSKDVMRQRRDDE